MGSNSERIDVEVAYARPDKQVIVPVNIAKGGTAMDAVKHSGIQEAFPEIVLDESEIKLGIFGKICKPSRELRQGDRVEIYRPLIADPKAVRRQRAAEGKRMKKGGGDLPSGAAPPEGAGERPGRG